MLIAELSNRIYTLQNKPDKTASDWEELQQLNKLFYNKEGMPFPMKTD